MKYTFIFSCTDNGGGHQSFEVRATDKQEAIEKGMKFAKKYACGDICGNCECKLKKEGSVWTRILERLLFLLQNASSVQK